MTTTEDIYASSKMCEAEVCHTLGVDRLMSASARLVVGRLSQLVYIYIRSFTRYLRFFPIPGNLGFTPSSVHRGMLLLQEFET